MPMFIRRSIPWMVTVALLTVPGGAQDGGESQASLTTVRMPRHARWGRTVRGTWPWPSDTATW